MRAFLVMVLAWGLVALPACEQSAPTDDSGFASVFPDGSVFADGQLLLPDGHVCIGAEPPQSAYLASPGPVADVETARPDGDAAGDPAAPAAAEPDDSAGPEDPCGGSPATCVGEPPPLWALYDFQPQSCGYEAVYGLDNFKGRPTVAVLLAAW